MSTASNVKLPAVRSAHLPTVTPWPSSKRVRAPSLKLVLFVVWAEERRPLPRSLIAHLTGLSGSQVDHTTAALVKLGVIRRLPAIGDGSIPHPRYEIVVSRLRDFVEPDPPMPKAARMARTDAERIRELAKRGELVEHLATRFGVTEQTIRRIIARQSHA